MSSTLASIKMKILNTAAKITATFLIFQILFGCMILRGRLIPPVTILPDKAIHAQKQNVFIEPHFHGFIKGINTEPVESVMQNNFIKKRVKTITERSKAFDSYTFDKSAGKDITHTLQIDFLDYTDETNASIQRKAMFSGFTLGLIPFSVKDKYRLTAKLSDSAGNEIKTYVYEDYVKTWVDIMLLPAFFITHGAPVKVIDNMIMNLYRDIRDDSNRK